jgi:hypothetical protein
LSEPEHDTATPLPTPISLTLEEALQVAGGLTFNLSHDVIINGRPADLWGLARVSLPSLIQTVAQFG